MADKRPFIIFGIAALLILTIFIIFRSKRDRYSWDENYEETNKSPYGTFVVYNLLKDYFPEHKLSDISSRFLDDLPLKDTLNPDQSANFIFIGEGLYLDTSDVDQLLDFVEAGNTAFISSKSIPYDLMYFVYSQECNGNFWYDYTDLEDTLVSINLIHANLKDQYGFEYEFLYRDKPNIYRWQYIDSIYFCEEDYSFVPLGKINDNQVNFVKMNYGEGAFYLHTTPITFSNIQLLKKQGLSYANKIFSHLNDGPIYWDKYSRVQEEISRRRNQIASYSSNDRLSNEGPLSYILKQSSLAWAWYLALIVGLLYLLFRAKRAQRIIPVMDVNANTSLEFISTIGRLYFLQNDHKKLCLQKMKLFLSYVRERYNISTNQIDETFINNLSLRSEVPEKVIGKIVMMHQNIRKSGFISEKTMIDYHLEMDKFYKNRK
jgi:hypothetical protein